MTDAPPPTLGAIVHGSDTHFRLWANRPSTAELVLGEGDGERRVAMERDGEYWTARTAAPPGTRYRYRLEGQLLPDPCSRRQPEGVHGPSEVVDPGAFPWTDAGWQPPGFEDLAIYEAHIGTFTPGGTFDSAAAELARLRDLGITAVEVMPIAAFPGRWNWGYDGVAIFAPAEVYGGPAAFRRFVDAAHAAGLAVILDVVYNHLGPEGNYTGAYSSQYTTAKHQTPWGDALNFDDEGSAEVRRFFRENLLHWVHEYHVDGFRFDATDAIADDSATHILAELRAAIEAHPRGSHRPWCIAEAESNDVRYLRPLAEGGFGFDAVWADDFHHAVRTLLTPGRDGYLANYNGTTAELARTLAQGFLYEGEVYPTWGRPRGTPAREQPWRQFVYTIQNHDQIGNHALGLRLNHLASPRDVLAAATLLLLLPQLPLLFQGQEFLASTPFLYFTDHSPELGRLVTEGRREEFSAFAAFADPAMRERIPDPQAESTFRASVLRLEEAERGIGALSSAYHRDLLHLRRSDPVLRLAREGRPALATWLEERALVVGVEGEAGRRLVAVNFGENDCRVPVPGLSSDVRVAISSDHVRYGGAGCMPEASRAGLFVPAHTGAFLLAP